MSLFGLIFSNSAEQRRQSELDAQIREMNERDYSPGGRIYERIEAERGAAAAEGAWETVRGAINAQGIDVRGELREAFGEGLREGADSVSARVGGVVDSVVGTTGRLIPWQVWIILGVLLLFWMGAGPMLKDLLKTWRFK
jgi:hypothetical protein